MQQGNWMAELVAASFLIGFNSAIAAGDDSAGDGCAALSSAVYHSVSAAGLGGWRSDPSTWYPDHSATLSCDNTATAVSAGFTQAMQTLNLYVTWPTPEQQRGDVCLSHDLSQCYPQQHPFVPTFALSDAAFVMNSWVSVQTTVLDSMPAGAAANVSRFNRNMMNQRLQRRLQHATRRSLRLR